MALFERDISWEKTVEVSTNPCVYPTSDKGREKRKMKHILKILLDNRRAFSWFILFMSFLINSIFVAFSLKVSNRN
jgi:hypothetical protein